MEEAYRTVKVNDGERQVTVEMAQAVIRSMAVNAAKGNARAQRLFTELLALIEEENWRDHKEMVEAAIKYKVEWEEELARRKALGLRGPEPLPHPDDVVIDVRAGTVQFKGPLTKEEKAFWDDLREWKRNWEEEIQYLTKRLKRRPRDEELRKELDEAHRIRARLAKMVPD